MPAEQAAVSRFRPRSTLPDIVIVESSRSPPFGPAGRSAGRRLQTPRTGC